MDTADIIPVTAHEDPVDPRDFATPLAERHRAFKSVFRPV